MNETALTAIKSGSITFINGEPAIVADEIPNKEAIGLAQTPTQAPLLQQDNKMGAVDVIPPVMLVQIDFLFFIILVLKVFRKGKMMLEDKSAYLIAPCGIILLPLVLIYEFF